MLVLLAVFFHPPWKILLVPLMIASLAVIIIITLFAFFFSFSRLLLFIFQRDEEISRFFVRELSFLIYSALSIFISYITSGKGQVQFFFFFECSFLAFLAFHLNKLRIILFLRYFAHFQYIAQFSLEWMFITVIFLVYPWFLYPKWLFINRKWVLFGWHNSIYGISLIFRLNSINSFISHLFLFALSIGDGNKIYWINSIFRQFPHAIGIHIFVLHSREFA